MKTPHETEELLRGGRNARLSSEDKEGIKAQLLARARRSYEVQLAPKPSAWQRPILRFSLGFALVMLVMGGTVSSAHNSLPGEPLYALKVQVLEDMVHFSKFDPKDKTAYQVELMETRFKELKSLTREAHDTKTLGLISDQIEEHIDSMEYTISTTDDAQLSHEEKIAMLQKITTLAKAQASLAHEDGPLAAIAKETESHHRDAVAVLASEVEDFVVDTPHEAVADFLSSGLAEMGILLQASSTGVESRDDIAGHLLDVSESLEEGDTEEAVFSILEAQQVIAIDAYLEGTQSDSEDLE